jgi:glycosyltransferase involved in cell wall biosynthesis
LDAFKKIDNPDLNLVIIGVENKQEFLKGIDVSVKDRVTVMPKTPFDKLAKNLSAADIIVIPQRRTSDSIGQIPARLFDAMAMAKPILATRVSDIPEVLGDCGYLTEPNEPSQLADAIQYILAHSNEAQNKGQAARERCKQMYDMSNLESGLKELIERVAVGKDVKW